jgi:hypothetical protein
MTTFYESVVNNQEGVKQFRQDLTAFKNSFTNNPVGSAVGAIPSLLVSWAMPPAEGGLWAFVRQLVGIIKAHPDYTESVGEGFGIIGDETSFDPDTFQPDVKLRSVLPGHV